MCAPSLGLIVMAFLWSPGQNVFFDGFATFWLGALAVGSALVLSVRRRRRALVVARVAVVGLLLLRRARRGRRCWWLQHRPRCSFVVQVRAAPGLPAVTGDVGSVGAVFASRRLALCWVLRRRSCHGPTCGSSSPRSGG